jgi:hypothetical protein
LIGNLGVEKVVACYHEPALHQNGENRNEREMKDLGCTGGESLKVVVYNLLLLLLFIDY